MASLWAVLPFAACAPLLVYGIGSALEKRYCPTSHDGWDEGASEEPIDVSHAPYAPEKHEGEAKENADSPAADEDSDSAGRSSSTLSTSDSEGRSPDTSSTSDSGSCSCTPNTSPDGDMRSSDTSDGRE